MSLYGAMFSGVSGLSSQSSAMGAIADNISNVNTIGYKGTTVNFQTLVTKQSATTSYAPGGTQSRPRANIDMQGLLQATNSSTDMAVSGNGFFVVNQVPDAAAASGMFAYSRAGSFKVDDEGYLRNVGGYYLQGWPLERSDGTTNASPTEQDIGGITYMKAYRQADGTLHYVNANIINEEEMRPLNLNTIGGTATATAQVKLGANLPEGAAVGDQKETSILMYDSFGNTHNVTYTWEKAAANEWDLTAVPPRGASNLALYNDSGQVYASSGRIDFTALPANTDTISIGGTTYTFNNNTAATPITSTDVPRTAPSTASVSDIVSRLATMVNINENGALGTAGGAWSMTAGDTIRFNDGTTSTDITLNGGDAIDDVVSAINAQSGTTGITAVNIGGPPNGQLGLYNTSGTNVTITQTAGTPLSATIGIANGTVLPAGTNRGQRFSANGSALEIVQTKTGASIAVSIPTTTSWSIQGEVNAGSSNEGQFTVESVATGATSRAVTFDGRGAPTAFNVDKMGINWATGALNMMNNTTVNGQPTDTRISVFMGNENQGDGLTQLGGEYGVNYITQDGAKFGNFAGVSVGEDGVVTALFDNGVRRPIFQIPVATFVNANGMESLSGNVWIETDASGQYTLRSAGESGAGTVQSSSLESSTVDMATEFTTMITTQRAYSAAAKIITTSDEMMDELLRIKR